MSRLDKPENWFGGRHRLRQRTNIIPTHPTIPKFAAFLRKQADLLDSLESNGHYVSSEHIETVCELDEALDHVNYMAPYIEGWCCISVYDPNGRFRPGEFVTWSAHLTAEQANEFLPYWEEYLDRPKDKFTVVFRAEPLSKFYHPLLKPDDIPWNWRR